MPRVNFWGREAKNGEQGPQAECPASMCAADAGTVEPVLPAEGRECAEPAVHGDHQQAVPGNAVVWLAANGAVHEAKWPQMWPPSRAPSDAAYEVGSNLSGTQYQQEAPTAQDLALSAEECGDRPIQPSLVC